MEIEYREKNFNSAEILYNAQVIADAFAESLKQNNCLLMLTVSIHQEVNDAINDLVDLERIDEGATNDMDNLDVFDNSILDSIQDSINYSKSRCYSCKLTFPLVDFDMNFDAVMGRLRALLDTYNSVFQIGELDLCQASYAMKTSCLPDILKLIVLLVTAYAAILMLKNIGSISVLAFIKGVISALLEKIFSALRMSVAIGSTNTACIVEALREISLSLLPTEERILAQLDRDTKRVIRQDEESLDGYKSVFANDYIGAASDALSRADSELSRIDSFIRDTEKFANETFSFVTKTIDTSMEEVNSYIQNMLAFKLTFECEAKRSGTDVTEVIKKINNLIQVLNLLSAVSMSIAKKDAREKICSSDDRIDALSDVPSEDIQLKDVVEEYYGKEAEIVEDPESGIQIIIYDKPKEQLLPKIDLLNCSIDDFIDSHNIDNVIKIAEDQVKKELEDGNRNTIKRSDDTPKIGEGIYVLPKPSPDQLTNINNIVNILYDDPEERNTNDKDQNSDSNNTISIDEISNIIGTQGVSDIFKENNLNNSSLNCRTIDDVMSVLSNLRR